MKRFIKKTERSLGKQIGVTVLALLGAALTIAAVGRDGADHGGGYRFQVEISGTAVGGVFEVGGLKSETDVIEYRDGSEPDAIHPLPGLTRYNITLKRGLVPGDSLWQWRQNAIDGELDLRDGTIAVLDRAGGTVARYHFVNAWPKKWEATPFHAAGNDLAIETIEIIAERIVLGE